MAADPAHWRVAAARSGRVLAATAPREFAVGAARVRCAAPVPPAVMMTPAEGWIVGGLYFEGGPFPGFDSCSPSAYTITARNAAGAVVARQSVAGGHSYTLVLPAGMYTLETASGTCHGSATVRPAKQTMADTVCYVP